MSKHTPGPWKKFDSAFPQFFVCVAGKDICKVSSGDVTLLEAEANANLIAAAPDLLDALESAVYRLETFAEAEREMPIPSMEVILDKARSAIARARGEA